MENELKKLGAHYEKGLDWSEFVVEDGNLVTGQNPASLEDAVDALLAKLG